MQIKLYGNGHFCNIPVQEIIDIEHKIWEPLRRLLCNQ